jgi:hypothetical protein
MLYIPRSPDVKIVEISKDKKMGLPVSELRVQTRILSLHWNL